jgi:hypothetical protein
MHARSTRPSGRARFAAFAASAVLALGTALLGTASPAQAAAPKLNQPTPPTGWSWVTLTGTADAGATVQLWEAAYQFRDDMYVATAFFPEDIVSTTATASGQFTLRRRMDSGFRFKVQVDGVFSNSVDVPNVAHPALQVSTAGSSVTVDVVSEPGQPGLPVAVQRQNGSSWTTLVQGSTGENGVYSTVLTNQPAGTQHYRAQVGPDPVNLVALGTSVVVAVPVGGSGTPTTPPTTRPTPAPTTPTPTPKPTTPAPAAPKAGDVRFSLVQYNPAGKDTASTKSLNAEYWRITNMTKKTVNLKFWYVKDRAGNTYRFPSFSLTAGRSVTVATGKGTNGKPAGWRYWGRTGHLLNNTGDALYLRTGSGKLIDGCNWGNGSGRTAC